MTAQEQYEEPTLDLAKGRAQRYAEALAAAAGAGERIRQLTEALEIAEYHRDVAECQLSSVEFEGAGKVWTAADGEPEADAVLDLRSGAVWHRLKGDQGQWVKRDGSDRPWTRWQWPPQDAGPFIAFEESWGLSRLLDKCERQSAWEDKIRRQIKDMDGYQPDPADEKPWHDPPLGDAVLRVIDALRAKLSEVARAGAEATTKAKDEAGELRAKLDELVPLAHQKAAPVLERFRQIVVDEAGRGPHTLVKQAELEILQDVEVPEDGGDPAYSRDRLLQAAAWLVAAAAQCEGGEDPPEPPTPSADLPF